MSLTAHTFSGCQDCLMAAAGYSEDELGHPYPTDPAPLSRLYESTPWPSSVHTGDALDDFSTQPCDTCGSTLAGDRHEIVALYR